MQSYGNNLHVIIRVKDQYHKLEVIKQMWYTTPSNKNFYWKYKQKVKKKGGVSAYDLMFTK